MFFLGLLVGLILGTFAWGFYFWFMFGRPTKKPKNGRWK